MMIATGAAIALKKSTGLDWAANRRLYVDTREP